MTDRRIRPVALLVGLAGFLVVAALVRAGITEDLDTAVLGWFAALHGGPLDIPMLVISEFGGTVVLAFFSMFAAGLLWFEGARRSAAFLAFAFVLSGIASDVLKAVFGRARPPVEYQLPIDMPPAEELIWLALAGLLVVALWRTRWRAGAVLGAGLFLLAFFIDPSTVSTRGLDGFPSGHAFRSVVVYGALAYVLPDLRGRRTIIVGLVVLVLIGISRVYLGAHHPSDVLGGWFGGVALVSALSFAHLGDWAIRRGVARPEGFEPPTY